MPKQLMTIEEYIVKVRKKDTLFIGFNPSYAKVSMKLPMSDMEKFRWLHKKNVNWEKHKEFLSFMQETMPEIELTEVFDNVPIGYIEWPLLGTMAIDTDIQSQQYQTLIRKYEDDNGEPFSLDAVLYTMTYEIAQKIWAEKSKFYEEI